MRHTFWVICCGALWLGLLTPLAPAQEGEVKERAQPVQEVFQTGLVYPQERGEVQLTYTFRFRKGEGFSSLHTPLNLEYGITDRWQVGFEWDALSRRTETGEATTRGRGDLQIATQYSFMKMRRSDFHSAVGVEITLPTGGVEKELSEGFIEYEPYLIVARDFPKLNGMQIFSQLGVGFVQRTRRHAEADDDEPAAHNLNLGIGMFVPFRRLVFTGEANLSTNRWNNGGREREMYATPGMVWRLPRNWEMGVGAPFGLTRDADKSGLIFKVVYEFGTRRGDDAP
jgi:Putative MetA-pathway of phenol degradation